MTQSQDGLIMFHSDLQVLKKHMDGSSAFSVISALSDYIHDGTEPKDGEMDQTAALAFDLLKAKYDAGEKKKKSMSESGTKAAQARWEKQKKQEEQKADASESGTTSAERQEPEPQPVSNPVASLYDPEWKKVSDAYMKQIGMLPAGISLERLISYTDDLGGDVVCFAIEETNKETPDKPQKYLMAILNDWANAGIQSREQAEAYTLDRKRKIENDKKRVTRSQAVPEGPPAIEGKFY